MKNLIFTLFVITCCYQFSFGQCGPTSNLGHQFYNGINTFSWNSVPNATQYDVYVQEGGYGWEHIATTTSHSFQTPGGVLSGSYEFYVETTCQNGDVHASAVFPFTIPCPEPTNPFTSNISQSGATLNWTNYYANDQHYQTGVSLAYRPLGTSSWISLQVNPLSFSYTMANLQPNTTYEWCVNLDCPYFDSNPVISQFTTLQAVCSAPGAPALFAFTNTSLQVQWLSPQTPAYIVQYKASTSSSWITVNTNSNTMYNITGLSSGTTYDIRVARVCSANNVSPYSAISTFTTNCISLNNSSAHIRYVQLNGFLWTSGADPNGYLYGNASIPLTSGNTYTLRLAGGGQINNGNKYNVAVYLDANQNYIYEAGERVFGVALLTNTSIRNYTFTVPASAATGITRLRIVMLKQNQGTISPCPASGLSGEVEDYTVHITPPAASTTRQFTYDELAKGSDSDINSSLAEVETADSRSGIAAGEADEEREHKILISPNPAVDFCLVTGENITSVRFFDAVGKMIYETTNRMNLTTIQVDLAGIKSGVYVAEICTSDGKRQINKVIKH